MPPALSPHPRYICSLQARLREACACFMMQFAWETVTHE
jgi:hypothetical protein